MKKLFLITILSILWTFDSAGQFFQWAKMQEKDFGANLAVGNNRIATAGIFFDTITVGNQTFVSTDSANSYVAVHNQAGMLLWAKHIADEIEYFPQVAVDKDQNVLVAGTYLDSLYIGGLLFKGSSVRRRGVYVAKFDSAGTLLWARSSDIASGNFQSTHYGLSLSPDGSGNVILAGIFQGSITFSGTTLTGLNLIGSLWPTDAFLVKYDPAGNMQWARNVGDPLMDDREVNLKATENNSIYLANLSTTPSPTTAKTSLSKISAAGTLVWNRLIMSNYADLNLATDHHDNCYFTGYFSGTTYIATIPVVSNNLASCYVGKFDANGNIRLVNTVATNLSQYISFRRPAIYYDRTGYLAIAGVLDGTAQFQHISVSAGQNFQEKTFLAKLDTVGIPLSVSVIPGSSRNFPTGLSGKGNNLYLSGSFLNGNAQFGPVTLNTSFYFAGYLAKIDLAAAPVGVKESNPMFQAFRLYPNPANNYVTLEAELEKQTVATVTLLNMVGQTVKKVSLPVISHLQYELPLENLPKGVYLVRLETELGLQTKRLVVQ